MISTGFDPAERLAAITGRPGRYRDASRGGKRDGGRGNQGRDRGNGKPPAAPGPRPTLPDINPGPYAQVDTPLTWQELGVSPAQSPTPQPIRPRR